MAAALSDQQLAAVERQLTEHPEILQALQENQQKLGGRGRYIVKPGTPGFMQDAKRILQQYGVNFPDVEDYQIQVDPSGQVHLKRSNWFQRNADWIVPLSTIGTAGTATALAPAAGAVPAATTTGGTTAAGTTAAGVLPSTATVGSVGALPAGGTGLAGVGTALGAGTAAGTTAGAGAGTAAAAGSGSGSILASLLPSIIGAGATLGGTALASKGATDAAKIQADSNAKALAQAKEIWQQQRADEEIYRNLGAGGAQGLAWLSGITLSPPSTAASAATTDATPGHVTQGGTFMPERTAPAGAPASGQAVPRAGSLGAVAGSPTSLVRAPNGQTYKIPASQLAQALQQGGTQVQ